MKKYFNSLILFYNFILIWKNKRKFFTIRFGLIFDLC